jgi:hypothetical protein
MMSVKYLALLLALLIGTITSLPRTEPNTSVSNLNLATIQAPDRFRFPEWPTSPTGNPFIEGFHHHPEITCHNGTFWVLAVSSDNMQIHAWESTDLVFWTRHANIMFESLVKERVIRSPAGPILGKDGRYYLFFSVSSLDRFGGNLIGTVADSPGGPYWPYQPYWESTLREYWHPPKGMQWVDPCVFVDDDGTKYLYAGGTANTNDEGGGMTAVARLRADMRTFEPWSTGELFQKLSGTTQGKGGPDVPLYHMSGGMHIFKRRKIYYMLWTRWDNWHDKRLSIVYSMGDSPLGPFPQTGTLLKTFSAHRHGGDWSDDEAVVNVGNVDNPSVVNVPGTDIWYIVYARRPHHAYESDTGSFGAEWPGSPWPMKTVDWYSLGVCIDRLYFGYDGTIRMEMGLLDTFGSGNGWHWNVYNHGVFRIDLDNKQLLGRRGMALWRPNTAFFETNIEVDIMLMSSPLNDPEGNAGVVFRVSSEAQFLNANGHDDWFVGYYAGLSAARRKVMLGKSLNWYYPLFEVPWPVEYDRTYRFRATAKNGYFKLYIDGTMVLAYDHRWELVHGQVGVRCYKTLAAFDNFYVRRTVPD